MAMDTTDEALILPLTDGDVLAKASYDSTWTWWEHTDTLLERASGSPHTSRIRVRYNTLAATQLDSAGRLVAEPQFPDSSAVVKEIYLNGSYYGVVVMYKAVGDEHAGHGSWLWFEFAEGEVTHSVAQDDGVCHNCHVQGIDHMRMPDSQ